MVRFQAALNKHLSRQDEKVTLEWRELVCSIDTTLTVVLQRYLFMFHHVYLSRVVRLSVLSQV